MTDRELLKKSLDALEYATDQTKPENLHGCDCLLCTTILALRDRLAQSETPDATPDVTPYVIDCPRCGHCCPQPNQEPVAWWNGKESVVFAHDDICTPNWTDYWTKPLYAAPQPCPTCESLARTVMMDQTGHDPRQWVGLTDEEIGVPTEPIQPNEAIMFARVIEALLKEKNT
jgi:hypothetical protein